VIVYRSVICADEGFQNSTIFIIIERIEVCTKEEEKGKKEMPPINKVDSVEVSFSHRLDSNERLLELELLDPLSFPQTSGRELTGSPSAEAM